MKNQLIRGMAFFVGEAPALSICEAEDQVGTQVLGWILTAGAALSFVPQMISLIVHKNLDGVAALTGMLNYLSNMATMVNAVMLNWDEFLCCQELSALKCVENIVPLAQLSGPFICTFIVFALITLYSNHMTDEQRLQQEELQLNAKRSVRDFFEFLFGTNSFVVSAFIISVLLTAAIIGTGAALMVFLGIHHRYTVLYADVAGVIAVAFLMVMYIPQLYTTYKAKHAGSLSITTLAIQAPGSLASVYFMAVQSHLSWTTWGPYFVSAIQQFILIGMCAYYHFRSKYGKTDETVPLLPHKTIVN